jgi:hypothetical protein
MTTVFSVLQAVFGNAFDALVCLFPSKALTLGMTQILPLQERRLSRGLQPFIRPSTLRHPKTYPSFIPLACPASISPSRGNPPRTRGGLDRKKGAQEDHI